MNTICEKRDLVLKTHGNVWEVYDKKCQGTIQFTIDKSGNMSFTPKATNFRYKDALITLCEEVPLQLTIVCKEHSGQDKILSQMFEYFRTVPAKRGLLRTYCSRKKHL